MDKAQAIHGFWSGFGLTAYDENAVPDDATYPYITYSVVTDSLDYVTLLTGSVWYRETTWTNASQKAEHISSSLKNGMIIKLDRGYIYLYRGTPFAERMGDEADDMIKRVYFNVNAEYLTDE